MRTTTATAHVSAIPSLNPIPLQNPNPDAELNEAADHLTSAISHMVSDLNAGKSLDSIFLIYPTAFASEYATATASASASADPAPAPAPLNDAREWWSALHQHVDFVVAPLLEPPKPKTQSPLQMECFHSVLIRVLFWCAYCLWVSHPFPGRGRANLGAQPTGSSSLPQARFIMPLGKLSRAASIRTDPPPPSFFSKATTFFPFVFFVFSNRLILDYFPNRRHKKKCCKY